jgi:HK97 gp10 family phage protein
MIPGGDELIRKLKSMDKDIQTKTRKAALLAGGSVLVDAWKAHISTEYHNLKTGTYRRSVQQQYQAKGGVLLVGTDVTDPPYPWWLEIGTSKMAARPALTPAFEESEDDIIEAEWDALKLLLGKY